MREPLIATIGLGANLGDARQAVEEAMQTIAAFDYCQLHAASPLYRSAPVDSSGPDYFNAVLQISTRLSAPDLLARLHQLERGAGRERPYRNAPRTLDLDILLYGTARIDSPTLTVPHPRMRQRAFVLRPLADIAPALVSAQELQAVSEQVIEKI
ncbi:MAG: 2-amino-4-hydroxy-6-hydroxymethyldihydropteridine diphosphokinase [Rhodoferax sp.]|nr:2-amino-4-hydroxy-6-hydroxymethyldihydropteridine diphosphokinase [Rhodoferax sp.]MBJ7467785.1 2-amino-4-hydroxy-6-hydroxymethyldihydropteridine diphosphokinase [Rhodoferax sp.]